MKRLRCLIVGVLAVVLTMSFFVPSSTASDRRYKMKGEISAIEPGYNTVVIEVPMNGKLFTVGGPLSGESVLKKAGQPADLSNFAVGDQVTVEWLENEDGHMIRMLMAE